MSTFFRGITEIVPSRFRGIFSERDSVPNPSPIVYSSERDFRPLKVLSIEMDLAESGLF
jgi:hypothetical protein